MIHHRELLDRKDALIENLRKYREQYKAIMDAKAECETNQKRVIGALEMVNSLVEASGAEEEQRANLANAIEAKRQEASGVEPEVGD